MRRPPVFLLSIPLCIARTDLIWRELQVLMLAAALTMLAGCEPQAAENNSTATEPSAGRSSAVSSNSMGIATFAGGCFWCTEADFDKVPGVISTTSGYIGGKAANPTYKQVSSGKTGHVEAVQVRFNPSKTDFVKLLAAYWPTIDPLTPNAQFCDIGSQYRSAIFYHSEEQKQQAEASRAKLEGSGRFSQPIVTEILPATEFYPAEEYHQDYYLKNPLRYSYYRSNCGRDARLVEVWGTRAKGEIQ